MTTLIEMAIAGVLIAAGLVAANDFGGATTRLAMWVDRSDNRLSRSRGPHRWGGLRFQARVYRAYGWTAVIAGFLVLNWAVHR